jgi:hypothetical protein
MDLALVVLVGTLLVLSGIGGGLGLIGYRKKIGTVMWIGIVIMVVVLAWIGMEALFWISCIAGAGCV